MKRKSQPKQQFSLPFLYCNLNMKREQEPPRVQWILTTITKAFWKIAKWTRPNEEKRNKNERPNYNSNSHRMEVFLIVFCFFHSKATISLVTQWEAMPSDNKSREKKLQNKCKLFSSCIALYTFVFRIFVCGDSNFFCRHPPLMLVVM